MPRRVSGLTLLLTRDMTASVYYIHSSQLYVRSAYPASPKRRPCMCQHTPIFTVLESCKSLLCKKLLGTYCNFTCACIKALILLPEVEGSGALNCVTKRIRNVAIKNVDRKTWP